MTRRDFLTASAVAGLGCAAQEPTAAPEPAPPDFLTKVGAQLYTVRNLLPEQPRETLQTISEIGYHDVEVQDSTYPTIQPILAELGMSASSYRIPTALITGNWEIWGAMMKQYMNTELEPQELQQAVDTAAGAGFRYMAVSYLLPPERETEDALKKTIEQYNQAGEVCAKSGLKLCHHNHAVEFAPLGETNGFELMMSGLEPDGVYLQLDVFWAAIAGQDPAAILRRFPGRIPNLHLKDKAAGTPDSLEERSVKPEAFVELGAGTVDLAGVIRAAEETGVERYYVEQDQSADPLASLRTSYEYLKALQV